MAPLFPLILSVVDHVHQFQHRYSDATMILVVEVPVVFDSVDRRAGIPKNRPPQTACDRSLHLIFVRGLTTSRVHALAEGVEANHLVSGERPCHALRRINDHHRSGPHVRNQALLQDSTDVLPAHSVLEPSRCRVSGRVPQGSQEERGRGSDSQRKRERERERERERQREPKKKTDSTFMRHAK